MKRGFGNFSPYMMYVARCFTFALILQFCAMSAFASEPDKSLISDKVISDIRAFLLTDIVRSSIADQNARYGNLSQDRINQLDQQWRKETQEQDQPLITSVLFNPASAYLTRVQALSQGLYTEIFIMDRNGLNAGQSNITSDYWQGDEAKFQKTFPVGPNAVFIDEPELNEEYGTWRVQVNMTIDDASGNPIGAAATEVNLTELIRRNGGNAPQGSECPKPECPTVECPPAQECPAVECPPVPECPQAQAAPASAEPENAASSETKEETPANEDAAPQTEESENSGAANASE